MIKSMNRYGNKNIFIKSFLNSRGLDEEYLSKKLKISKREMKYFFRSKITLKIKVF